MIFQVAVLQRLQGLAPLWHSEFDAVHLGMRTCLDRNGWRVCATIIGVCKVLQPNEGF